jgi:hypothetical protein
MKSMVDQRIAAVQCAQRHRELKRWRDIPESDLGKAAIYSTAREWDRIFLMIREGLVDRELVNKYMLETWAYWSNLFDIYLGLEDGAFHLRLRGERQLYFRDPTTRESFSRLVEQKWKSFENHGHAISEAVRSGAESRRPGETAMQPEYPD